MWEWEMWNWWKNLPSVCRFFLIFQSMYDEFKLLSVLSPFTGFLLDFVSAEVQYLGDFLRDAVSDGASLISVFVMSAWEMCAPETR